MSYMQRVIARMALTASPVELCTEAISLVISPVALRRQRDAPRSRHVSEKVRLGRLQREVPNYG